MLLNILFALAGKVNVFVYKYSYNLGQNILNKTEKSSKTGQDKKSLISTFTCVLTAIAKV